MNDAKEFWALVVDVWNTGIFGVDVGQVLLALGVFIVFLVLRRLFSTVVIAILHTATRRTRNEVDDKLLEALRSPLRFVFVVAGFYAATRVAPFPEAVDAVFTKITRSLIAFTIFWSLYRAVEPLSFLFDRAVGLFGQQGLRDSIRGFFTKVVKFAIVAIGVAAILEEWDFNVGAVLGGLGLIGMAVAFGAQNLIANLFAGLSIFVEHIFEDGDWIRSPDVEGTVESIGFRTTKVRRFDKALTTIPNVKLSEQAVVNFSRMTNRRIYWLIGLEYRSSAEQLQQVVSGIRDYVMTDEAFETAPSRATTMVHVDSFNASSIDIMLYCFTKTTSWTEWMAVKETLALEVKRIVEEADASFAFPSQSLYVETLPFGKPEPFPSEAASDATTPETEPTSSPAKVATDAGPDEGGNDSES
ncbi:MAG: mechanosensitive ion channel family protein [Alphaproteobacteria bacterium]